MTNSNERGRSTSDLEQTHREMSPTLWSSLQRNVRKPEWAEAIAMDGWTRTDVILLHRHARPAQLTMWNHIE